MDNFQVCLYGIQKCYKSNNRFYNSQQNSEYKKELEMNKQRIRDGLRFAFLLAILLAASNSVIVISNGAFGCIDSSGRGQVIAGASSVDWWPMWHHDPGHTAFSTSKAPNSNVTCWISHIMGDVKSSPAVVDGMLYIATENHDNGDYGRVYALNAITGEQMWTRNVTGGYTWIYEGNAPAVANGMVYVSVGTWFHALNASNGEELWNFTMPSDITPPCLSIDRSQIYVCSSNVVYGVNALTGNQAWNCTTCGCRINHSPAARAGCGSDYVYVPSYTGNYSYPYSEMFYILYGNTGGVFRNRSLDTYVFESIALSDWKIFVTDDAPIYALDDNTLEVLWNANGYAGSMTPAIAYGMLYASSCEGACPSSFGMIGAFDINSNGTKKWEYRTGGDHPAIPGSPAVADGKVFVGAVDHKIYAFNAKTGSVIWTYETGDVVRSSPVIADGRLYVGSTDGNVYAFAYDQPPVHDIAITNLVQSPIGKSVVCQNYTTHFVVTLENQGDFDEQVNVTLRWNTTEISTATVSVRSMETATYNFTWNTTGLPRYNFYRINAYAQPVQGENDTSDNTYSDGTLIVSYAGDVNADKKVDIKDSYAVAKAFGSSEEGPDPPGHPWNPNCDINDDHKVDSKDSYIVSKNYGYEEPP
jgi:outer membrane protein assembly factor BamB